MRRRALRPVPKRSTETFLNRFRTVSVSPTEDPDKALSPATLRIHSGPIVHCGSFARIFASPQATARSHALGGAVIRIPRTVVPAAVCLTALALLTACTAGAATTSGGYAAGGGAGMQMPGMQSGPMTIAMPQPITANPNDPAKSQLRAAKTFDLGQMLVDGTGYTIYRYDRDTTDPSRSNCTDACADQVDPGQGRRQPRADRRRPVADRPDHPRRRHPAGSPWPAGRCTTSPATANRPTRPARAPTTPGSRSRRTARRSR